MLILSDCNLHVSWYDRRSQFITYVSNFYSTQFCQIPSFTDRKGAISVQLGLVNEPRGIVGICKEEDVRNAVKNSTRTKHTRDYYISGFHSIISVLPDLEVTDIGFLLACGISFVEYRGYNSLAGIVDVGHPNEGSQVCDCQVWIRTRISFKFVTWWNR
jgi:hypothetical protein